MKNIYLLPTDKPSRLFYNVGGALLFTKWDNYNGVYIYITSDEEIKEGDWVLFSDRNLLYKVEYTSQCFDFNNDEDCKKIILTTDRELNKAGVWGIEDGFLEWFVKNPTCEYVELKGYAIILPGESCDCDTKCDACKEEAKSNIERLPFPELVKEFAEYYKDIPLVEEQKQETLEEYIERETKGLIEHSLRAAAKAFICYGAKWQAERMYSEEEARAIWSAGQEYWRTSGDSITFEELTEKLKRNKI